jgi:hypothetical protein
VAIAGEVRAFDVDRGYRGQRRSGRGVPRGRTTLTAIVLLDSTPVECGRSVETARRSQLGLACA